MNTAYIAIVISILGVLFNYFAFVVRQEGRITRLEVQSGIFWKALENKLADMLKSPTHLSKDILLDKFKDDCLDEAETMILRTMLTEEYNKKKTLELSMFISRLETRLQMKNLDRKGKQKKC